jgi:hypothetical protein
MLGLLKTTQLLSQKKKPSSMPSLIFLRVLIFFSVKGGRQGTQSETLNQHMHFVLIHDGDHNVNACHALLAYCIDELPQFTPEE